MASNYALINEATGLVGNVIVWDGVSPYELPENHLCILVPDGTSAYIGVTKYLGGEFVNPPPMEE